MRIGVDYYPEHWDRKLWEADADLIKEAGVKLVRLAEFAWSKLESQEDCFDFEWLDEIIAILTERNIDIVLCTPTNCPPLWMYEKYPEIIQIGKDGKKLAIGIRGHRCYTSTIFRSFAKRIIRKMAEHYAGNKHIVAWQIDNELEANFCCCESCIKEYRSWLKNKYQTLEAINDAYMNNVWSGSYSSWEQINPPFGTYPNAWLNPSFQLDFNRYASDSTIEYIKFQTDILRSYYPKTPITTNTWFCENMPDFYKEFEQLDFCSYDNYPTTKIPDNKEEYYTHAFHLDLMRGVKRQNFWIMEQLSGGLGCWAPMSRTVYPGMLKGYSLQAFAHGADTVLHFRWRTAVGGAEMHWHGIIDHSNVPGRRYQEFKELCQEAEALSQIRDSVIKAEVAVLFAFDHEYAFKNQPQTNGMYYMEQLKAYHEAFLRYGVNIDIVNQTADLSDYKIVVAPTMYIYNQQAKDNLYAFAQNGGTVILTNRSGVKNEYNTCVMEQLPTVYQSLTGTVVEEYNPIGYDVNHITMNGETYEVTQWCDILKPQTAEAIAEYSDDFYAGKAAVTRNQYGNGTVYYVGVVGRKVFYQDIVKKILEEKGIEHYDNLPENVEVVTREAAEKKYRFIFNNDIQEKKFELQGEEVVLHAFEMIVREVE